METLFQDLRYGVRMLLKSPAVTAVAVFSLALGISANTVIFSVINTVLLKSLPYTDADGIVLVWGETPNEGTHRNQVSATDVGDWRNQNSVFEDVATYSSWRPILSGAGEPERVPAMQVGDGYFKIMKGEPILGRTFLPEEQEDGKDFVVILGHGLWQRSFGGDSDIVGKTVVLNSRPYTVVGVLPESFRSLPTSLIGERAEFYRPVAETHDNEERSSRHLRAIARLKPGVPLAQAQAEMNVIAKRLEQEYPRDNTGYGVRLVSLSEDTVGGLRPTLLMLVGAVAFVLLIACANVGNLLLARSAGRQKEIAIRSALGAARRRLVRQLLTESVMLAMAGGGLGLLFALWGASLVESVGSKINPMLNSIPIDLRVLGFTVAISALTGIVFGLAPALHISRIDLNESLKEGGGRSVGGASRNRLRGALVVSEVAMALVLLISAGLLIRTVTRLRDVNTGFDPENLLTMNVSLPGAKYPNAPTWIAFYNQIIERIESLPGVKAAGVTSVLPFSGNFDGRGLAVETRPKPRGEEISVDLYIATPGYLRAMEIPLLEGRTLTEQDVEASPFVALVNKTMAEELWPNDDAIGKRIKFPGSDKRPQPWRTVVGVVSNVAQYGLDRKPPMQLYLPESQFPTSFMTLVVRTGSDPAGMTAAIRNEILAVDKAQAVSNIATMEQLLGDSISLRRFSMLLLIGFAGIALTLATVGIYGVISYTVTQRSREIGIRMALGAGRKDILKLVVGQGMTLTLAGVGIGLGAAFGLTRVMEGLLFGVSATDPVTFVVISTVLAGVALGACFVPARRATKVDPMIALRCE
ncbi:MAG TPA: ABC transporter permease [Blastocatellia bacterium]|nr:ABC transporter permease [Blastocatellia bacterium]